MIKKILFSLFISFVGLISFSSAGQIFITNGEYTTNDNLHYDFTFQNGNNFLANGEYRVFSVFSDQYYPSSYPRFYNVFWTDNGLYVIQTCQGGYECSNIHTAIQQQGYIGSYCKTTYSLNCTDPNISIESFIGNDNYKNPSSFTLHDAGQNLNFCFDYEDLNESLCFNAGVYYGLSNSLGFSYNPFPSELGTSADTISSYFSLSPRGLPSDNNGGGQGGRIPEENSSVVYFPCTNGDALDYYKNKGYTKNLCYGGDYFWDLGTESYAVNFLTPGVGYNYYDIYEHLNGATGTGNTYLTGNQLDVRFNYWRGQYTWWTTQSVSNVSPFSGYPQVLFGLFDFVNRYGIGYSSESIIDYCNLELYQNPDGLDMLYNGYNKNLVCDNKGVVVNITGAIDGSGNIDYDGLGIGVGSSWGNTFSGDIFSGSNYTGGSNPAVFIKNLVDDIKAKFSEFDVSGNTVGFLPAYIVVALFGIIIFNFLRK